MIGYGLFQLATGELVPDMARHDAELAAWESKHRLRRGWGCCWCCAPSPRAVPR